MSTLPDQINPRKTAGASTRRAARALAEPPQASVDFARWLRQSRTGG